MTTLHHLPRTLGCAVVVLVLAGCGGSAEHHSAPTPPTSTPSAVSERAPAPGTEPSAEDVTLAAMATVDQVTAHEQPDGTVAHTLDNPIPSGAPLTFLVVEQDEDWLKVQLPVRPNGTTGWIPADDVEVVQVPFHLEVSTADNELTLFQDGEPVETFPVATGTGDTPTPLGTYYLTELIAPTNAGYGPFAYGISAFSEVLTTFGAGPGQIGLHGTDDEGSIGQAVSHGCIRLSNEDITMLAELLPLGTPITIT